MRLPKKDSSTYRGIITALQAIVGFAVGLVVVVWNVPGVPEAVVSYSKENIIQILGTVGISSGVASFAFNVLFRKDVRDF